MREPGVRLYEALHAVSRRMQVSAAFIGAADASAADDDWAALRALYEQDAGFHPPADL